MDRLVDQFISLVTENTDKVEKFNFEREDNKVTLSVTIDATAKTKKDKVTVEIEPKAKRVSKLKETPIVEEKPKRTRRTATPKVEEKPAETKKLSEAVEEIRKQVKKTEPKVEEKKTRTRKTTTPKTKIVDHTGDPEIDIVVEKPKITRQSKKQEVAEPKKKVQRKKSEEQLASDYSQYRYDPTSGEFVAY